jgi:hypothetical protein
MLSKNRIFKILFTSIFIGVISIPLIFSAIDEDRLISKLENRQLTQFPRVNKKKFLDGEFFNQFEKYFTDQLYGRDIMVNLYSSIQIDLLQKKKINNILIGKEDYLFPYNNSNADVDTDSLLNALTTLKEVVENYNGDIFYIDIPDKDKLYNDMYPNFYENNYDHYLKKEKNKIDKFKNYGINVINSEEILEKAKENDEFIYFKTDNHYTFKGAYYVYQELLNEIKDIHKEYNLIYPSWDSMNKTKIDKNFVGSYSKQLGKPYENNGDYLEYALPLDYPEYEVYQNKKKVEQNTIVYNKQWKDISYSVFMGSNAPNTVVKTNRLGLPNILIIGNSFTNPLEVMATYNFNEMHSIDPRYWTGNISEYITENKPDIVVVVRDDLYEGNKENKAKIE